MTTDTPEIQPKKIKTCPYCFVPLTLEARICFSCKKKVGKINKHGLANKPVNYWSYFVSLLVWTALVVYILWAFF